jgi:hypothetical protein
MTITATFAIDQYTVTVSSGGNGTVNPDGDQSVDHGNDLSISATPETGYHFVEWTVTVGLTLGDAGSASTKVLSVTSPGTVTANFAKNRRFLR